jgi:plasmid stabilization system protein ParE
MTYRIIIEPTAEREIRSAVRWKTEHASPSVAARWYNGLLKKIAGLTHHNSEPGSYGKFHILSKPRLLPFSFATFQ